MIKAYWLPVWKETRNGVCLGYKLNLFASPGHKIRNYTVSASVLSLEITGLEVWTNYSIKMAAFTIAGVGKWSDAILVDTTEESKPYTITLPQALERVFTLPQALEGWIALSIG